MRVTRELLSEASNKSVGETLRAGAWGVWPTYGLAGPLGDPSAPRYVRARPSPLEQEEVELYAPLVDRPGLFLEFARLADDDGLDEDLDSEKNAQAVLKWARSFGVLGLTRAEGDLKADTRGGAGDTVEAFAREAWHAHGALRIYEAATAPDGPDLEILRSYDASAYGFFSETPARAQEWALRVVASTVQAKVAAGAHPALYAKPRGGYAQGWDFSNLLGAMWLQKFWLLSTDPNQQRRCKWCNRVIAFRQPEQPMSGTKPNNRSGGYKTRVDKQFCSDRCRYQHHQLRRRAES